jgi:hypothetical protein
MFQLNAILLALQRLVYVYNKSVSCQSPHSVLRTARSALRINALEVSKCSKCKHFHPPYKTGCRPSVGQPPDSSRFKNQPTLATDNRWHNSIRKSVGRPSDEVQKQAVLPDDTINPR